MSVIQYGYCHCGCGQKTNLSKWTDKRIGTVKGKPYKFLNGHCKRVPIHERFWLYVNKMEGCWEWTGSKDSGGYGTVAAYGKVCKAHRVSWTLHFGTIPIGIKVLHKCDNPQCVRPEHLFLGTQDDNMKDCAAKGRIVCTPQPGEQNPMAVLTDEKVKLMRQTRKDTGCSYKKLALQFRVSTMTAFRAVTGQSWSHLEG